MKLSKIESPRKTHRSHVSGGRTNKWWKSRNLEIRTQEQFDALQREFDKFLLTRVKNLDSLHDLASEFSPRIWDERVMRYPKGKGCTDDNTMCCIVDKIYDKKALKALSHVKSCLHCISMICSTINSRKGYEQWAKNKLAHDTQKEINSNMCKFIAEENA